MDFWAIYLSNISRKKEKIKEMKRKEKSSYAVGVSGFKSF